MLRSALIVTCITVTTQDVIQYFVTSTERNKMAEESKVYRVNPVFLKRIKKIWLETTIETKKKVEESDVVNAVLYKFLDQISINDVKEYRREIKGKDE